MGFNPGTITALRHDLDSHAARLDASLRYEREQAVRHLPFKLRADLLRDFSHNETARGFNQASREFFDDARTTLHRLTGLRDAAVNSRVTITALTRSICPEPGSDVLGMGAPDPVVREWARKRAGEVGRLLGRAAGLPDFGWMNAYAEGATHCRRWGIEPAPVGDAPGALRGAVVRMMAPRWWRKRARALLTSRIESAALAARQVHARGDLYISGRNFERWQEAGRRNADMLRALEVVSDAGDVVSLKEVADAGVSNPKLRRCELMVRVKGMEVEADSRGYVGLFLTWTLPSRFHPVLRETGAANKNHNGETPRDGQSFLMALWKKLRAVLAKRKWPYWGLRVAEPHHDATPHWHMLMFFPPHLVDAATELFRRYALKESPDEPGAQQHRFAVELIQKGKGSATAYVAKYISKNTDARGVDFDNESGAASGSSGAQRARAWASAHRFRQFQFVGAPPVGLWREFRRQREPVSAESLTTLHVAPAPHQLKLFERARSCADAADYAGHVAAVGGFATPRKLLTFTLKREQPDEPNQYGEPAAPRVRGISLGALFLFTRPKLWRIRARESERLLLSRTRVNNCNHQGFLTNDFSPETGSTEVSDGRSKDGATPRRKKTGRRADSRGNGHSRPPRTGAPG